MLWFKAHSCPRCLIGVLAVLLWGGLVSGCGFKPVYGVHNRGDATAEQRKVSDQLAQVGVVTLPNRNGQVLRNLLIDRLYAGAPNAHFDYQVEVDLKETVIDLGIRRDAVATRGQIRYYAAWRLVDRETAQPLFSAEARSTSSYNILDSEFATLVSEDDARERGLRALSEQIVARLALYFQHNDAPAEQ